MHRLEDQRAGGGDRIRSVDGLRALAFMLVYLFHSWEFSGSPRVPVLTDVVSQNTRPDLFIVLTGFVLFLPFARDEARLHRFATGEYLARRLRRIVPPYYAALALAIALPFVLKALFAVLDRPTNAQPAPALGDVVAHLTFTHMFFEEYWDGLNGSLWTMSLEMQLYLLFPLLVIVVARWGLRGLVPVVAVAIAYRMLVGQVVDGPPFPDHFLWGATALGRLMEFAAGMLAAVLAMRWRHRVGYRHTIGLLAAVIGFYLLATVTPWGRSLEVPVRETALGLSFGLLVVLAIVSRRTEAVFLLKTDFASRVHGVQHVPGPPALGVLLLRDAALARRR